MQRFLIVTAVLIASTAANADFTERGAFSSDIQKILVDDRAWFYLRVCADDEVEDLRALLNKYGAIIYRDNDNSDGAAEWRTRYRDDYGDPAYTADCASVREFLRGTIYAPAIMRRKAP